MPNSSGKVPKNKIVNFIKNKNLIGLIKALNMHQSLDLSNQWLSWDDLGFLSKALESNTTINDLNLQHNARIASDGSMGDRPINIKNKISALIVRNQMMQEDAAIKGPLSSVFPELFDIVNEYVPMKHTLPKMSGIRTDGYIASKDDIERAKTERTEFEKRLKALEEFKTTLQKQDEPVQYESLLKEYKFFEDDPLFEMAFKKRYLEIGKVEHQGSEIKQEFEVLHFNKHLLKENKSPDIDSSSEKIENEKNKNNNKSGPQTHNPLKPGF